MGQLRVVTGAELRELVDMPAAIDAVRAGFEALARGRATVPLRTAVEAEGGTALFMPARTRDPDALGGKVVSVFPGNRARGVPVVSAAVLLLDPGTGAPRALLDGTALTALRTGAATGVATDLLARPDARVLALFGAGAQAPDQVAAVRAVRPVEEVRVVSRGGRSARELAGRLEEDGVEARAVEDPAEALRGADLVVAVTDSREPVFPGAAVEPGAHVNGVGSFTPEMREVDGALLARAEIFVDDRAAALAEAGELIHALAHGGLDEGAVLATVGEVAAGLHPGRSGPDAVTFFESVGNAVEDLAVAARVLEAAEARGVGTLVEL